jgi:hypothetical protein
MKAATRSTPPASSRIVTADPQPQVLLCISGSTIAARPGTSVSKPGTSSRWPGGTRPSGRVRRIIAIVKAPTGRLTQKTQRQLTYSVNNPPTRGPSDRKIIEIPA